jgi:hypothetical protein
VLFPELFHRRKTDGFPSPIGGSKGLETVVTLSRGGHSLNPDVYSVEELWEQHEQYKKLAALDEDDDSQFVDEDENTAPLSGKSSRSQKIKVPRVSRLQSGSSSSTTQ